MWYFYSDECAYVIVECPDTLNIDISSWREIDYVYDWLEAKEMCDKHNRIVDFYIYYKDRSK